MPRETRACVVCGAVIDRPASSYKVPVDRTTCRPRCMAVLRQRGRTGPRAQHWKGGTTMMSGYARLRMPDHPRAARHGYVKRAVVVMEATLGRALAADEDVHHINGDKLDDRPENLEVLTHAEHTRRHWTGRKRR